MKKSYMILVLLVCYIHCNAQSITKATIGGAGGKLQNGNITLDFTLGESIVGLQSSGNTNIANGFWAVVPAGYSPAATTIYRFTGNGNFTNPANWENGLIPPNPLPTGTEILINPAGTGECSINTIYRVSSGAKFSVVAGKKLVLAGNLIITGE